MHPKWTDEDQRQKEATGRRKRAEYERTAERRPYIQILAVGDSRDEPYCRTLDGIIADGRSQWAKDHWPPHCYGCRCTTITLSERDLQRKGLTVTPAARLPR